MLLYVVELCCVKADCIKMVQQKHNHYKKEMYDMAYDDWMDLNHDGEIDAYEEMFGDEMLCTSKRERRALFGDDGYFDDYDDYDGESDDYDYESDDYDDESDDYDGYDDYDDFDDFDE